MKISTINEISKIVFSANDCLIFCHARPDGDTLGSAFAIKTAFDKLGKRADIVCADPVPEKFRFLPQSKGVLRLEDVKTRYSMHLSVDCASESMIGDLYALYSSNKSTVNVDHHVSNSRYAQYDYVDDKAACCEIIFELISAANVKIDEEIADALMLGVSTDTGNFMHANVTANTFDVASKLASCGGDIHNIAYQVYKNQSIARLKLLSKVLDGLRLYSDDRVAVISVTQAQLQEFGATKDLTEGFIDYPLSVSGVEVAVSILESKPNCYKISLRSKGKVNVNEVASAFGGGGHVLASGCMISGFYEDVKDKLLREIGFQLD